MWGQTSQNSSSFVPKRDCGSKGVKSYQVFTKVPRNSYVVLVCMGGIVYLLQDVTQHVLDTRRHEHTQCAFLFPMLERNDSLEVSCILPARDFGTLPRLYVRTV